MTVSVRINISLAEGLEIVHYLEKYNSIVVIENEIPHNVDSISPGTSTVEAAGNTLHESYQEHYGIGLENTINRDNIKTVSVKIDASSKDGQELVKELEKHPRVVQIDKIVDGGVDEITQKTYPSEYAENLLWEKLNKHFGTDIREL